MLIKLFFSLYKLLISFEASMIYFKEYEDNIVIITSNI